MGSKDVRNAIIALIILAIGALFLTKLGKVFFPRDSPIDFSSILASIENMINIFLIGIVIIIIILIPIWVAKKREEMKQTKTEQ